MKRTFKVPTKVTTDRLRQLLELRPDTMTVSYRPSTSECSIVYEPCLDEHFNAFAKMAKLISQWKDKDGVK